MIVHFSCYIKGLVPGSGNLSSSSVETARDVIDLTRGPSSSQVQIWASSYLLSGGIIYFYFIQGSAPVSVCGSITSSSGTAGVVIDLTGGSNGSEVSLGLPLVTR